LIVGFWFYAPHSKRPAKRPAKSPNENPDFYPFKFGWTKTKCVQGFLFTFASVLKIVFKNCFTWVYLASPNQSRRLSKN